MTSSRVTLCEHILFEHFGSAVGRVGSVLLARGRLSYETLVRLIPSKMLSQRNVMASLIVLIQHNCLFHVQDDEDGLEYFEIDVGEVLQRRRYGTLMGLAKDTWGRKAGEVLGRVLNEGKIQLATLVQDCQEAPTRRSALDDRASVKAIYDLLHAGVLRPVKNTDQHPSVDQDLQFERELIRRAKGPLTPKDLRGIKAEVEARRNKIESEPRPWGQDAAAYDVLCEQINNEDYEEVVFEGSHAAANGYGDEMDEETSVPSKRKATGLGRASTSKAARLHLPFDPNAWVRVVFTPFDIRLRNEAIVKAVRIHRGGAAARLVQGILNDTIAEQYTLDEVRTAFVAASRLVEPANKRSPTRSNIPLPDVNGHDGMDTENSHEPHAFFSLFPTTPAIATYGLEPSGYWDVEHKEPIDLVVEVLHTLAATSDVRPTPSEVKSKEEMTRARLDRGELRANCWLATDQSGNSRKHVAAWAVDFASSMEMMKVALVESYIGKKYGKIALRVWRVMDEKGKMDEKTIGKTIMTPPSSIREVIGVLTSAGLLVQQDIPRTQDRAPGKAFFVWHVSRPQCYGMLLNLFYDALVNISVRREKEKADNRALIRKSERRDVRDNLELLDLADRNSLADLKWKLESLGVAQERIDRDIFVLETLPSINTWPDASTLPTRAERDRD